MMQCMRQCLMLYEAVLLENSALHAKQLLTHGSQFLKEHFAPDCAKGGGSGRKDQSG